MTHLDDEAREWLIRLRFDDVDAETMAAWEAWLAQPDARTAYDRALNAWSLAGLTPARRPASLQLATDRYDPAQSIQQWRGRHRRRSRFAGPLAAGVLIALALGIGGRMWWTASGVEPVQSFATERAEHRDARLSDGSEILLAAMTDLQVSYDRQSRAVAFDRGEALFKVAKDPARPFVVSTPRGNFTAVGTAFNVDVRGEDVELFVTEGVVSVNPMFKGRSRPASDAIRVSAGQRLVVSGSSSNLVLYEGEAAPSRLWWEGRLEYRDAPLGAVIADVNRYTLRPIVLGSPGLDKLTYTGTVLLDAADTWAFGLVGAFPVAVESQGDKVVLRESAPAVRTRTSAGAIRPTP